MQNSKTRSKSTDMAQKTSPVTPRSTRQPKPNGFDSGPNEGSPKPPAQRSPRSPASEIEKKRVSRVFDLETRLLQAQQELKKTKEVLSSVESSKRRALQEAEEAKKQFSAMASKLDEKQRELLELSASEEARIQELRKLSLERDRAWQSELDAVQRQSSVDSAALSAAINEIHKLKMKVEANEAKFQRTIEEVEMMFLEGKILSTLEVQSASEFAERVRAESERALMEKEAECRRVKEELEKKEEGGERKCFRVTNQEMEAELRRVKIQSEQWRKAAEAAAAILSAGKEGKLMNFPYEDDEVDEGSPRRKNATGLRKLFWKRGQK